jgi:hypothetical protein
MNKKYWVMIILSGILLFHFLNNFIWLERDNYIYGADSRWHLIEAVKFHIKFTNIQHSQASFFEKTEQLIQTFRHWQAAPNWPPLIYLLSASISPKEIHPFDLRLYINFIFYILLVLSTYFLGKKCFNRRAGLIAAFLVSFYPAVCADARQFGLDFPLLCVTAACICLLVHSENFSKRGYSLLFGLSLGMGMLVKLQIMFFLLVPLLYATVGIFRPKKGEILIRFSNFILSAIIAFGLFYLYWGDKIGDMLASFYDHVFLLYPFYTKNAQLIQPESIPIFSWGSITYYLRGLLFQVSFPSFILFAGALGVFLFSKNKWRNFFLLSLLVPYLIFSFISIKWVRYVLPLLPFIAIISGWLIDSIRLNYIRIPILCLLIFHSMGFYLLQSWMHTRFGSVLVFFSKFRTQDTCFSKLYPPDSFDYTGELKKAGIIPHIEQGLRVGKTMRVAFDGDNVEDAIVLLYFYFQDAILNGKITIQDKKSAGFQDADLIVTNPEFLNKKDLLKNHKILYEKKRCVFLIRT